MHVAHVGDMILSALWAHELFCTVPCCMTFFEAVHAARFQVLAVFGPFVESTVENLLINCSVCLVGFYKTNSD